jgi:hypothetical protein
MSFSTKTEKEIIKKVSLPINIPGMETQSKYESNIDYTSPILKTIGDKGKIIIKLNPNYNRKMIE